MRRAVKVEARALMASAALADIAVESTRVVEREEEWNLILETLAAGEQSPETVRANAVLMGARAVAVIEYLDAQGGQVAA